jgi:hypothetical protein
VVESGSQQIVAALVGGLVGALVGAFGGVLAQRVSGWWGLQHRKAEVYLSNKTDSYAALFVAIHQHSFHHVMR